MNMPPTVSVSVIERAYVTYHESDTAEVNITLRRLGWARFVHMGTNLGGLQEVIVERPCKNIGSLTVIVDAKRQIDEALK